MDDFRQISIHMACISPNGSAPGKWARYSAPQQDPSRRTRRSQERKKPASRRVSEWRKGKGGMELDLTPKHDPKTPFQLEFARDAHGLIAPIAEQTNMTFNGVHDQGTLSKLSIG